MNCKNINTVNEDLSKSWLSIIIPIYNAKRFIRKCLDSILEQTYTDFEVILIDDESNDSSSDICKKYSVNDNRFRYIRKDNGGAYQSRIYGAERTLGTYITFCDADYFYINKNAFACLYEEITKSNCQALQFGYIKKYNHLSRKSIEVKEPLVSDKDSFYNQEYPKLVCSFWDNSHLTTNVWNKVYHRSLILNLPSSKTAEIVFWGDDQIVNLFALY